jgi:hypothetical protein
MGGQMRTPDLKLSSSNCMETRDGRNDERRG